MTTSTPTSKPGSSDGDLGDNQSEIREAWLWGSVAVHQDPAEGKTKGQDASGEALYLDNRGKDKAITFVFQRELEREKATPRPAPPASGRKRRENDHRLWRRRYHRNESSDRPSLGRRPRNAHAAQHQIRELTTYSCRRMPAPRQPHLRLRAPPLSLRRPSPAQHHCWLKITRRPDPS